MVMEDQDARAVLKRIHINCEFLFIYIFFQRSDFLFIKNLYHIRLPPLDHFIVVCIHCILVREIFFKGPDSFLGNYCIEVSALHDIRLFRLYTVQIHQFIPDISRDR